MLDCCTEVALDSINKLSITGRTPTKSSESVGIKGDVFLIEAQRDVFRRYIPSPRGPRHGVSTMMA